MIRLIITGAAGKMGKTILNLALEDKDFKVTGLVEKKGHPLIGKGSAPVAITDELASVIKKGDVIIDFTDPQSSLQHFMLARRYKKAIIIGTTGFSEDALSEIRSSKDIGVVISPNMSIGMNLMFDLVDRASRILKGGYDIEIIEMHHRWKKDAPSGTAMRIKDIVKTTDMDRKWTEIYGRKGVSGERRDEEIGILALRGGDIVGEHTIIFAGIGERLEITHRAYSRENFARGALLAAKWITTQGTGIYSMKDVLGL